jgi:Zn-finger nucleic acid-binding protein
MDCTNCKNPMITAELESVEIDFCGQCGGIWLDAGELESLLGDEQLRQQAMASFALAVKPQEEYRKCPICRKKMEKVSAGHAQNMVLLDRCGNHGIWFDKGELSKLLESGAFDPEGKVVRLLREMFNG